MANIAKVDNEKLIIAALQSVPCLAWMSQKLLSKLIDCMKKVNFEPESVIFDQSQLANLFIIIHGNVRIIHNDESDTILKQGDYCGALNWGANNKNCQTSTAFAVDNVECMCIDTASKSFCDILQKYIEPTLNKRLKSISDDTYVDDMDLINANEKQEGTAPSNLESRQIANTIDNILIFKHLSKEEKQTIIAHMTKKLIKKGEILIEPTSPINTFGIIASGNLQVTSTSGMKSILKIGDCVGESALVFDAPSEMTAKALTTTTLWVIDRSVFRKLAQSFVENKHLEIVKYLNNVPLFSTLYNEELHLLADGMKTEIFEPNDIVAKQGDLCTKFFIIKDGTAKMVSDNGIEMQFVKNDYFGDKAMLIDENIGQSIQAITKLVIYSLEKQTFAKLLPSIDTILTRSSKQLANQSIQQSYIEAANTDNTCNSALDFDKLDFVRNIGSGQLCQVSLVKDRHNNLYALKTARKDLIMWHNQQSKMHNEAKMIKLLKSNNFVIQYIDSKQDPFQVQLLMEPAIAGNLLTLLRCIQLNELDARFYTACIIEGLSYIHSFGIVHRDIKPENLLITSNGYLKIADFSFAKYLAGSIKTFTMCGTPEYLAPEMVLGEGYNTSLDWWSLGITIYEMMTGIPPFIGNPEQVYHSILKKEPIFNYLFRQDCQKLVSNLLQKNSRKRLNSATQVRQQSWFDGFDWQSLENQTMKPPHVEYINKKHVIKLNEPEACPPVQIDVASWADPF